MEIQSTAGVSSARSFKITRGTPSVKAQSLVDVFKHTLPTTGNKEVDDYRVSNWKNATRGLARIATARVAGAPTQYGVVSGKVTRANGDVLDLGVLSFRVVTDVGVGFIVDAFQNSVELENMKYHGFGTGTTAEAASQTALVTELTTQYATDNTRPTGSTTEGATANIYRSVGTLSPDASVAITEHAIFSATSAGVMLDRSVFSAINLVSGDSLQITYDLTFTSGS
jgi:hypothetical protein